MTNRPDAARRDPKGLRARRSASRRFSAMVLVLALTLLAGCSGSSETDSAPTVGEIDALLVRHAAAVLDHDRGAFLAGIDARTPTYRSAQSAAFANLAAVPLAHWSYSLGPPVRDTSAQAKVRRTYGASARIVRVKLRYALRGADSGPTSVVTSQDLWWTVLRRDGKVVIASDTDLADAGGASWRGPWDFGPLDVVRGQHSLVLGHPDNAALLRPLADTIDAAVPSVTAVWGQNWSRSVAALVPSTPGERDVELGPDADVSADVAAVATADGQDPLTGKVFGQRLVVDGTTFRRLSTIGRQIVVAHEVTHIATAAQTSGASPRWLVEGFAEYVGNRGSGQPVDVAASELATQVRRGRVASALPAAADFDTASTAAPAYEGAWLACRLIARRVGREGLVRFYRLVGASPEDSDTAVATALRSVLHETRARFVAQWRAYVNAELGG